MPTTADYFADIIKGLLNKPKKEVLEKCVKSGYNHRVTSIDGEAYEITDDLDTFRLNLTVENDIVTEIKLF